MIFIAIAHANNKYSYHFWTFEFLKYISKLDGGSNKKKDGIAIVALKLSRKAQIGLEVSKCSI